MLEKLNFSVKGHLTVADNKTGEILEDKDNAIHPAHFALVFARALANQNYFNVHSMVLGNGGSFIDSAGNIIYNAPNTVGDAATLYNQTWIEVVDGTAGANGNSILASASSSDLTASTIVTAILSAAEPNTQYTSDTADINNPANPANPIVTGTGADFDFDELGLVVKNPLYTVGGTAPEFLLLTHLVFNPIQKNANRELILTYTLTISVS